ncbi:PAS domain-containing sensor histidine kinase [Rhodoplanes sp. TEM]|uniref:histidine kinase n=1 Tax=Rhodoplanes tepidamans TaxID=200616 RepID=A0ABT5JJD7_RHOTP|nr:MULTISPECIES: PAS domain-containing sensor histidine kinase [Rhodoplanes]MDC7789820.1 PAS domain-containing sensor histidine kinase [Rhodoplanes tepidamans]MDC7987471.1 PAS domain-containing sensor histidine kinase [Rhodoplanes sp. TEM]MDQ0359232.1 two-component system nitrogen regulation sensor histidine kinase NtrY [Rhodoplanes tepidamans]
MATVEEAATAQLAEVVKPSSGAGTRIIGPIGVAAALLSALVTFLVLAGLTPIVPTHNVVVSLLMVNGVAVALLLGVIGREVWQIIQARRRGTAGARLHVRIVGLFSVIAAAPAVLVAVVASITLDRGLDRFFTQRTRGVIANSLVVAEAYLNEHAQSLRSETQAMAFDVGRARPLFDQDRDRFRQFFTAQAQVRGLPVAIMLGQDRTIVEKADIKLAHEIPRPSAGMLAGVGEVEPQVILNPDANYVAGAIKLRGYDDLTLFVARPLNPIVVSQFRETQTTVTEFAELEKRRLGVQIAFALMFTVIALTVLLSAVWIGFNFANRLVAPIRRLIGAANVVSTGNLYVQVPVRRSEGDLAQLGETFNKMTHELRTQRDDIVRARDLIDSRRRFTEAVLAGASAGVIGVDAEGTISILNRSAEKLIGATEADVLGKPLAEVLPELSEMFLSARTAGQRFAQGQASINRAGRERTVSVRLTTEQSADPEHGYVFTLDDITDLVTAQRTSAWADVARRIAHEIKNPLTPIQLSAERLRRKYGKVIVEDKQVFEQCTDTIVRQVEDIRRMVDEFSRFARMPKPVMTAEDVADTVRQAVFLMRVGHADVEITADIPDGPMPARFDRRLISQALTNIIKNATEAIAAVPSAELDKGHIHVATARDGDDIVIDVVDNGIGLPKEGRRRLLEPYVTTREKGTGLGLAIVGKILEEHGGRIELHDAAERTPGARGAWFRLRFAAEPATAEADQQQGEQPHGV